MIRVELTEEQLRAALDVIGKRVSETNEHGTPLFMAERELDSALLAHENQEPEPGTTAILRVLDVLAPGAGEQRTPIFEWGHETTPTDEEMVELARRLVRAVNDN